MKTIQKTFSYCLKPTNAQTVLLKQHAGAARFIYNWGLNLVKKALEAKEKMPSYKELANRLTHLKKVPETHWLYEVHSQILQQSLKNLESAWQHFFNRTQKNQGFPRFKCMGVKDSFRFPQSIKCLNGKVYLPKIGWVAYRDSRPIDGIIKQATVKRRGEKWLVNIVCEIVLHIPNKKVSQNKVIGIDVGIKELAVLSNGEIIENPHFLKNDLTRLAPLQKAHSRKKLGSKNRKKSAIKISKLYSYIASKRKDYIHKATTKIVESQDVIIVETLNIKGMIRNRCLSRSIADASWRMFLRFLKYKADWRGKRYIEIPRFTPTSKRCSTCNKEREMPLALRVYECIHCGLKMDRDLNAALNIKAAGIAVLACGEMNKSSLYEAGITGLKAGEVQLHRSSMSAPYLLQLC